MNSADDPIYLDYNATTPLLPEVVDAMLPYLREHFGNPSSRHLYGKRAHDAIERARSDVAALINSHADEIIFTSGGTEANNLAIRGTTARTSRRRVVTSTVEHPATARPVTWLEQHGWDVIRIGVDAGGRARVPEIDTAITSATALVTRFHGILLTYHTSSDSRRDDGKPERLAQQARSASAKPTREVAPASR
jgi:cysteine desulfurase